jgi:hypothetical protein
MSPCNRSTPGNTGKVGKWSARYSSASVTLLTAIINYLVNQDKSHSAGHFSEGHRFFQSFSAFLVHRPTNQGGPRIGIGKSRAVRYNLKADRFEVPVSAGAPR